MLGIVYKLSDYLSGILLSALLVLFAGYSYLNARLDDRTGDEMLVVLLLIGFSQFIIHRCKGNLNLTLVKFFWIYLVICVVGLVIPSSEYADFTWFRYFFYRFGCGLLIVLLLQMGKVEKKLLQIIIPLILVFLCCFEILNHYEIVQKIWLKDLTPYRIYGHGWNEKFFASMLVFLTWGVIGLLWGKSWAKKFISVSLLSLSIVTLFILTSDGAILAVGCSVVVFILLQFFPLERHYFSYLFVSFSLILASLFLMIYFVVYPYTSYESLTKYSGLGESLKSREYIYGYSTQLIKEKPVLGHGFGSVRRLPSPDGKRVMPKWGETLPGGHPHSIFFLLLIEHGVAGFLFIVASTYYFYNYVFSRAQQCGGSIVALPLLISFQVLFFLSFSIWNADCIILAIFFMVMSKISFSDELN